MTCADLGCNVGGFTDCLLRNGAASVIAIDTGYGVLAWRLRNDDRVDVRERTNALHAEPPSDGVDLVTNTPNSCSCALEKNLCVTTEQY